MSKRVANRRGPSRNRCHTGGWRTRRARDIKRRALQKESLVESQKVEVQSVTPRPPGMMTRIKSMFRRHQGR